MPSNLSPGFIAIHGNQLEQLRGAVFGWLRNNPLAPLEQEIVLVQSNGVAEWLKIALAEEMGVCASTRITLPARFLWEAYRGMLGPQQVPYRSALDESTLTWRLMRLLPTLLAQAPFAPLRHFLADGDPERRLQLAQRLADLFDEYQVYRADWLADWAAGRDVLRGAAGEAVALADDQRWQPQLWRAVLASLPEAERTDGRAGVHQRFLDAIGAGAAPAGRGLPRRVVVFGVSALPHQTLQALGALATHMQVVVAVPNPCRYYWGDIIAGRDLLKASRRRQQLREGRDLAALPLEQLHAHSHPLLAGWGRLGRDFVRMLDEFDDAQATREHFSNLRIDLFSEGEGECLLQQVQASIRDMLPLDEHPRIGIAADDCSIEFHAAHSAQREVEILHDRLLGMFADQAGGTLRPRDVVVMVPDIEVFAPSIAAVFGQYGRHDARWIPFEIADVTERQVNPLLVALEWLLRLPQQRCLQSEVRDLLEVPALAARFGIAEADLPRLGQWIEGAGVRWGLDREHRASLGLGPAGEQNAWIFGIRRMLLGYANGASASYAGIEPYAEVGGLDAALAGALASFVEKLLAWRGVLAGDATPQNWGARARLLLTTFFDARDERDRLTIASLEQALQCWLEDCDTGGFNEPVPLAVLREAWLGAIDEPTLAQRFVSGGVTFCTLMPMRAVPFRVVCLLGMNDGDYPRRARHADFDLLNQPQLARPGDRSRRDDDRYLMLEALLAAREKLYVSWVGRNVRDNSEQPASVLVSQLRDYLVRGWDLDLHQITTEHPLQPFSRRYFEQGGLLTYAREWRSAHEDVPQQEAQRLAPLAMEQSASLKLGDLARFLRQPVKYFFRQRLQVVFAASPLVGQDEEPFGLDGLEEYGIAALLLDDSGPRETLVEVPARMRERAACLARQGVLPIGLMGRHWQDQLVRDLTPARSAWLELCGRFPHAAGKLPVAFGHAGLRLDDWIDKLRSNGSGTVWLEQNPGKLTRTVDKQAVARADKLFGAWVRQLAAAVAGQEVSGYLVGRDAVLKMAPLDPDEARQTLGALLEFWRDGLQAPLPVACKTALRLCEDGDEKLHEFYDGGYNTSGEASEEPCLARLWPDFAALDAAPQWRETALSLYQPLLAWRNGAVEVIAYQQQEQQEQQGAAA
ncbi:exodeoxyribonuclease V subunit gamma [Noviherbaspirillum sedimenti]|uniref:RecBCD enzyme subunit RecC n=1 Tax=Noviherbaspirillum sedimenti TaxID=2320865 RepID=A0A3A3G257_9BURK|nr:exodeoxyribonuclease V subunit gamma [Noviherbaspirillum sedimenti]RJG02578.1 exodeoxyribonuclease V subunit gamma [Noviherbaspirillum sedimenti]